MKAERLAVVIMVLGAALLLVAMTLGNASADASAVALAGIEASLSAPNVNGITPASAPNDLDTAIAITGAGFTAGLSGTLVITPPAAFLGDTALEDVTWVSATTLHATVPWGLNPGTYTLTAINPDGDVGSLPDAFTVTQGIGVWTTGGPYGGNVHQLTLHPITPTTIYAAGSGGLFVSRDAMQHWEYLFPSPWPLNLSLSPPEPDVLYFGSWFGLYRSLDGGETWDDITPPQHDGSQGISPLAHPATPGVVYIALTPDIYNQVPDLHTGVFRSADYGTTWLTMTSGLTDTDAIALAFYPDDPTYRRMVLGTANGNIFTSQDTGQAWYWAAHPTPDLGTLVINPHDPQEVWISCCGRSDITVYKSLDTDLTQWAPVDIDQDPNVWPSAPIFDPWGTLWSSVFNSPYGFYTSTDGGNTWQPITTTLPNMTVVAFDPAQPDLIYAGSNCYFWDSVCGMYKSTDRGTSWQQRNDGFAGIEAYALAVSRADPQQVYAYTSNMRGLLRSNNGGASWQQMNVDTHAFGGNQNALAVDPFTTTRVYLAGSTCVPQCDGLPAVEIVEGNDSNWHTAVLPVPGAPGEWGGQAVAVAPHPLWPGRLLASIVYWRLPFDESNPLYTGGWAISRDHGESWSQLIISDTVASNSSFSFDAVNPDLVYASTGAGPVLRSSDGGQHWQILDTIPAGVDCTGGWLLAHPYQTGRVLAFCSRIMRSFNGGETWTVSDREIWGGGIYVPTIPASLYWVEWLYGFGLVHSLDDGETWERVEGIPTDALVYAMTSGHDDRRVMLYVSYTGGFGAVPTAAVRKPGMNQAGTGPSAGVYRLTTILSTPRLFLPLMMRQ